MTRYRDDVSDQCVFCAIVAGRSPGHVVFRDNGMTGFLDIRPLFPGHTLVVPDSHHETIADLPSERVEPLFAAVRRLAAVMPAAVDAQGTFVAVNNKVSQSVPHLHVHVVPRSRGDGLRGFFWPRNPYEDEEHAASVAEALAQAYSNC